MLRTCSVRRCNLPVRSNSIRNSPIDLDLAALIDCLDKQVDQVKDGNLNRIEQMLLSQAHALDAIANNLFRRAIASGISESV